MPGRTQEESEQPAKVYQLDAVSDKVDQANTKLDQLLGQMGGFATVADLANTDKQLRDHVAEEVSKIHLKYGPMQRNLTWFTRASVVNLLGIVAQAIVLYLISRG